MSAHQIPRTDGEPLNIQIDLGQPLFIVGRNGSGKSALVQYLASDFEPTDFTHITAYRQTWLDSNVVNITAENRRRQEKDLRSQNRNVEMRWRDPHVGVRLMAALYDLAAQENSLARSVFDKMRLDDVSGAQQIVKQNRSPLERLNRLLYSAGMEIQVEFTSDDRFLAKRSGAFYSIAEMSDAERATALLAAQILVLRPRHTILIDEPERHLHRAIAVPLLAALVKERPDCAWAISTHELSLPTAFPASQSLLLRGVEWENRKPVRWSIGVLDPSDTLPEDLRRDILGARETIVFVEGSPGGIDQQLYEALINDDKVAVIPKGGWRDVQQAVTGLQTTTNLHHVRAFGIIDGDGRPDAGPSQLGSDNIFILPCWSIESLLYSEEVRTSVAHAHASITGRDPSMIVSDMESRILGIFSRQNTRQHLINARIHRTVVHEIQRQTPSVSNLESQAGPDLSITVSIPRNNAEQVYNQLVVARDLQKLIARYPIKETPVLGALCNALGWQDKHQYQEAAIEQIRTQSSLREQLRKRLEDLIIALARKN